MKFRSDLKQPTVKGAARLAVPPGSDPRGFMVFLELLEHLGTTNIPGFYLQLKKRKFGVLNVKMRVSFTPTETCLTPCSPQPRASSKDSLGALLPND